MASTCIRVEFEGQTLDEVTAQIREFLIVNAKTKSEQAPEDRAEKGGAEPAKQTKAEKSEKKEKAADAGSAASARRVEEKATDRPASAASTDAASAFKAVADIIPQLVERLGKPATIELLKKFNVKRAGELKPDQFASFIAESKKALAAA